MRGKIRYPDLPLLELAVARPDNASRARKPFSHLARTCGRFDREGRRGSPQRVLYERREGAVPIEKIVEQFRLLFGFLSDVLYAVRMQEFRDFVEEIYRENIRRFGRLVLLSKLQQCRDTVVGADVQALFLKPFGLLDASLVQYENAQSGGQSESFLHGEKSAIDERKIHVCVRH